MNGLLARRAEFTALFAMSDVIAFGAIRALVSAGFRVPEDVSVIGFDGITMSRYCVPVMTTIVQPSEQIALQSIELLVRQIEHGTPAQTVTLQPELQQGEKRNGQFKFCIPSVEGRRAECIICILIRRRTYYEENDHSS